MNKESFLYVVVFTFVVAFVFVFIIALTSAATAERIASNSELVTARAFLNAVGQGEGDNTAVLNRYKKIFGDTDPEKVTKVSIDGKDVFITRFQGDGLWGTVTGVIALNGDLSRVVGIDIISHSETPGLGGRIDEQWFKDQFRNERIVNNGIVVRKGEGGVDSDHENGIVDGITGASLTSASMEVIFDDEINRIREEADK